MRTLVLPKPAFIALRGRGTILPVASNLVATLCLCSCACCTQQYAAASILKAGSLNAEMLAVEMVLVMKNEQGR
jgi:hypothetical protein